MGFIKVFESYPPKQNCPGTGRASRYKIVRGRKDILSLHKQFYMQSGQPNRLIATGIVANGPAIKLVNVTRRPEAGEHYTLL